MEYFSKQQEKETSEKVEELLVGKKSETACTNDSLIQRVGMWTVR